MEAKKTNRVYLTQPERNTEAGLELLQLCLTTTSDGRLEKGEIEALKQWLEVHRETNLPAIGFLSSIIERILADGIITDEETRELHIGLEKVLPIDLRKDVIEKRKQIEREKADLERPIARYDFMVAGTRYGGRVGWINAYATIEQQIILQREPTNIKSHHATRVLLFNEKFIGYVPEVDAKYLAVQLDQGKRYSAFIKKILGTESNPIPVVVVEVYEPSSGKGNSAPLTKISEAPILRGSFLLILGLLLGILYLLWP